MFDKFADVVSGWVASAWFFMGCVLVVVLWLPSIFFIGNVDTWQLIINTLTTIVTFLMVALLQNTQERFEKLCIKQNREILTRLDRLDDVCSGRQERKAVGDREERRSSSDEADEEGFR